ncbi:MAG: adenylate/guanylate cyclase domain-containing protein [Elusimicrobia bacterium]|nr:adenylate/guanylate cyclase domain-containing protein [Elusimicrobiota bacterium]
MRMVVDNKDPRNLHFVLFLPLFLAGIDVTFANFFYIALGFAPTPEALKDLVSYGTGRWSNTFLPGLAFLYIPLLAWYYPIWRFVATRDAGLKEAVRRRISGLYGAIPLLLAIAFAGKLALHLAVYREVLTLRGFFFLNLPAMLMSLAVQFCFALVVIDNAFRGYAGLLMADLYEREELYRPRTGFNFSILLKVALVLLGTAVTPMLLMYFCARSALGPEHFYVQSMWGLLINSFTPMFLGVTFVLGTIQRPVDGLIEKMRRLASGELDVKTKIYFNDEIAQIKASFNVMAEQLKEREVLRETFGKYVSVEVARKLMRSGGVDLGGEEIEATVLFCDIRNFTPMSETMTPKEVVGFLNLYFSFVTEPIMENHGVINKFMGDAVMAVYTPALGSDDHVGDAVRSALGMRAALRRLNDSGKVRQDVRFGIGIQTGTMVAGNIGTLARAEYTVIGDTVNVAARLESATKEHGVDILVSRPVYERVKDAFAGRAEFRSVGPVGLKGKSAPVELYSIA